ncbi:hypothetical protein HYD67_00895 [Mycoplasmopsis bovis]|nr:hypothetical protein [Mycoplasmopsis bovis]QQH54803.1 hypothetical protein HYD67_00895 [Mycoplasmopsis bovis]
MKLRLMIFFQDKNWRWYTSGKYTRINKYELNVPEISKAKNSYYQIETITMWNPNEIDR